LGNTQNAYGTLNAKQLLILLKERAKTDSIIKASSAKKEILIERLLDSDLRALIRVQNVQPTAPTNQNNETYYRNKNIKELKELLQQRKLANVNIKLSF
jgi:hypothetical protein